MVQLIQGIARCEGADITVLLPYKRSARAKELMAHKGIRYKELLYRRNYKFLSENYTWKYHVFDFLNMLVVKRIQSYIQKEHYDIVCSNSTGVDVGARAARMAGVSHIYYVREFMEADHNAEYRNKERMKKLLESSEYAVFISKAVEAYYKSKFHFKNTAQFYDGFAVQDYYIKEHEILKKESLAFVQAGRFLEGKGTLDTIRLLHCLNQNGITDWNMEFIGEGTKEYIAEMKRLIRAYHLESQVMVGNFCSDMKGKLIQKDILIMNSKAEGFGRTTVEGMLAGCLVMGRRAGGTAEIIVDGANGITFESEEEFVDAVRCIAADRERYMELARRGQEYAMENFHCTRTAGNFMEIVEKCCWQHRD